MSLRSFLSIAAVVALLSQQVAADCDADLPNPCVSYGVDFQDGGSYFQNINSSDPFSFVSQFEGCTNDTAYNYLVDPQGNQDLCTNTNLKPDDTNQLATCADFLKSGLYTGDWSVVVMSNNGNDCPIANIRDFSLSVGPQQTTTYTPTVTITTTTTPLTSTTSTSTYTEVSTAPTPTTTVPSTTITPTVRVTPQRVTTTSTTTLATITKVKAKVSIVKTTTTVTPSCRLPVVATITDKVCPFEITVAGAPTQAPAPSKPRPRFARRVEGGYEMINKEQFVKERRAYIAARNALKKRAPDAATITLTDTNTADYITTTTTLTADTITASFCSTTSTTTTITPAAVTVVKGKTTANAVTIILPTPTRTIRRFTILTTTASTTFYETVTITRKTTPATIAAACKTAGGVLY